MSWTPFYFDGNQFFGQINSKQDWERTVAAYKKVSKDVDFLRRAKRNHETIRDVPSFGFYSEYTGPETLGEWADGNKMDLKL